MATVTIPKLTICPPAQPRDGLSWPAHPGRKWVPVKGAHATAHGMESDGLTIKDLDSFQITEKKIDYGREKERPLWVTDNKKLGLVLARWMQSRAAIRCPGTGTPAERIKAAQERIAAARPRMIAVLDGLCARLVAEKQNAAPNQEQIATITQSIRELDTRLRVDEKDGGLSLAFGVVNSYYLEGKDSFQIAEELGVLACHVRQTLWRLDKAWELVQDEQFVVRVPRMRINLLRGLNVNALRIPGKQQRQCWVCGLLFYPAHGNHKRCSDRKNCKKRAKENAPKEKQIARYYCGPNCKDVGYLFPKRLPVPTKPGVGTFVPVPNGDRYQNYLKFCLVVGTVPMSEEQWRRGLR
jgi:hypothetical protein